MSGLEIAGLIFEIGKGVFDLGTELASAIASGKEEDILLRLDKLMADGRPKVQAALLKIKAARDRVQAKVDAAAVSEEA